MKYSKYLNRHLIISLFLLLIVSETKATEKASLVFAGEMTEIATERKGGYPELASLLKQQRHNNTPTFFLFGGGSLGPSMLSSLDRGTHIIDLLNSLEPDAMGVAKREFSFHEDELSLRAYEAAFPMIASNLEDSFTNENLDGLVDSAIIQQKPYKFGVLSILSESMIEEYALSRVRITDQFTAVKKLAGSLRDRGAELVVLMYSNQNPVVSQLLTEQIIDISLMRDKHSPANGYTNQKRHPRDVLLHDSGKAAAVVNLEWTKGQPKSLKIDWQSIDLSNYSKDPELLREVRSYTDRLATLLQEKIGILTNDMDTSLKAVRSQENPFGNYVADAIKEYTHAEVALINGGLIRGGTIHKANDILRRSDIVKELPFRNQLSLLSVNGEQIVSALENGFSLIEKLKGRFPQVSGMQVTYDSSRDVGNRVVSVKINGKPLKLDKQYKLATSDYLAVGGDGYSAFKNSTKLKFKNQMSRLVSDVIIDSIKSKSKITVGTNARLVDLSLRQKVPNDD